MSSNNNTQETLALISRDLELEQSPEVTTEEELLQFLGDQVAWLIEHRMEFLMSMMYRLDIDETAVHKALLPNAPEPANMGLARLIMQRQMQRLHTRNTYTTKELGEEWEW